MAAAATATAAAHLSSDPASRDRWVCIYPAYLNSKKTVAEGRRVPVEKAVADPTIAEISSVCISLGLQCTVEKEKRYTRDWTLDPALMGRVRVQLKKSNGSPCSQLAHTRKQLFAAVGETIPKLKSRHVQGGAAASGGDSSASSAAASGSSSGGKSKSKKKKK